jgi:hypothetical protein
MYVVRQKLFAGWFFAARFQSALKHLQLIRCGEERTANGILADRVGDGSFLEYEVAQTLLSRGVGSG